MNANDITRDLSDGEKLNWLIVSMTNLTTRFDELEDRQSGIDGRLTRIETLLEDRLKDTRPILQAINARTERIEETLLQIKEQLRDLAYADLDLRASQARLSSRVTDLEQRMSGT